MSNITIGSKFERVFCELLAQNGYWVHRIKQNEGGQQPADVIAVKGKFHALIDCKVVSTTKGFSFDRVEDNQRTAMTMFEERGGEDGWFAILLPSKQIVMLNLWQIEHHESNGKHSLSTEELESGRFTTSLAGWMRRGELK